MTKYDVYGLGNALLDMEFEVTPAFMETHGIEKGVMTLVDEPRQAKLMDALGQDNMKEFASGGSAANTMIALQHFGGQGFYSCKVADDQMGQHYLNDLQAAGLSSNYDDTKPTRGITGRCLVLVTHDADRTMNSFLGISETLSEQELDLQALRASQYLYIEGYLMTSETALQAVKKAKKAAQEAGVKVAITLSDPTIVQFFKKQFDQVMANGVDLLFCNEEEAMMFTGATALDAAIEGIKKVAKTFAITRGKEGSVIYDGSELIEVSAQVIEPVDTVGAGDMYAGAFLAAITQGESWRHAGELASRAATQVVLRYGPRLSQEEAKAITADVKAVA